MQNFLTFLEEFLPLLASFLESEPIFTINVALAFSIFLGALAKLVFNR